MTDTPEIINSLIDLPQTDLGVMMEAGYFMMEMGKHKDAEAVFAGVSALVPHNEIPVVAMGNVAFAQGRYAQALKHHKDAVKLNPQSALAKAHMGEALMFLNKADDAVKALNEALALGGDDGATGFAQALLDAHADGALPPGR